jgi:transposase-like protein
MAYPAQRGGDDCSLAGFACPNPDCTDFNRFQAGNLSIVERMGKCQHIRRLRCKTCGTRFSERQGSLLQDAKLPEPAVERIIKCLGYGVSVEATADICQVTRRTVRHLLRKAGERAQIFQRLQLEKLPQPPPAVELDELHGRVSPTRPKKGGLPMPLFQRVVDWVESGFMPPWRR